ncbi:MAG TPA: hypothetical protein VIN65_09645 [Candidatus Dormibacteraeota bacterium]
MRDDPLSLRSLKLRRAQHHLNETLRLIKAYGNRRPYRVVKESELPVVEGLPDGVSIVSGVQILRGPPSSISAAFGDTLQDFKSALDHSVYELSRLNGATGKALESTEFIVGEKEGWYLSNRQQRLGTLPARALTYIDGLQPYLGVDPANPLRDVLRVLHELARIDRHRHIHLAGMHLAYPVVAMVPRPGANPDALVPPGSNPVDVDVHMPVRVSIQETLTGPRLIREMLYEIRDGVSEIILELARHRP